MTPIAGFETASAAALDGLARAVRQVDQAARDVAAPQVDSPGESSTTRQFAAVIQIHNARSQVGANIAVLEASSSLLNELLRLPRR